MDIIRSLVLSACFAAVTVSVIEILLPAHHLKSAMQFLCGAVFLIILISPLRSGIQFETSSIDFSEFQANTKLKTAVDAAVEESASAEIKQKITDIANEFQIKPIKIEIIMDSSADGRIQIRQADVYLPSGAETGSFCETVQEKLGLDVVIKECIDDGNAP